MPGKRGNPNWKKGVTANPNGRPPILLPEVQRAIDANKNAFKVLVLQKVEPQLNAWLDRIIEQGVGEGDVIRLKTLLEMVFGRMVHDPPNVELTPDESVLLTEYRRRKKEEANAQEEKG